MNAWNHHPLRTERVLSPLQLWQREIMSAGPQWQQEFLEGFSVPQDYGRENSGYCFTASFDQPSLVVPRINVPLTAQQVADLQHLFSPLAQSDECGIHIFVNVKQYILNVLSF